MLCATANHSELDETKVAPIAKVLDLKPIPSRLHGVASRPGHGFVQLSIRQVTEGVAISISNSGECDTRILASAGDGVGLANVRRRLALCYGEQTRVDVRAADGVTTIGFVLPWKPVPDLAAVAERG
jgi:LytS/YehU family sensor histidine kinase